MSLSAIIQSINQPFVIVTLTNYGYILYTLNMLKSLRAFGLDKNVVCACLDAKALSILQKKGYTTYAMYDEPINDAVVQGNVTNFFPWNTKGYDVICAHKLVLIHRVISCDVNVVIIDGDIVFRNNPMDDITAWNCGVADVYIQNDATVDTDVTNLCTGYMFVRATKKMCKLYDYASPDNLEKWKTCILDNNDQSYFNRYVKPHCNVSALPLMQYPNGVVFYKNANVLTDNAILIHFNWLRGHEKMAKMKNYKLWLLSDDDEEL
jgi:hypothetical protein